MRTITTQSTIAVEFFHCYVEGFYIFTADGNGARAPVPTGDVAFEFGKPAYVPFDAVLRVGGTQGQTDVLGNQISNYRVQIRGGRIAQDELTD